MSHRNTILSIAPTALALLALTAAPARAQELHGFDLERLELNPGAQGSLVVGTGALLPEGGLRLSLTGHYERNPLALYSTTQGLQILVHDRVSTHLGVAYAPTSWLELGTQLPLVLHQAATELSEDGLVESASYGLSTPHVSARVGLLSRRNGHSVDLAFDFDLGLPLGSASVLGRESGFRYMPRVMAGTRVGSFQVGLDAAMLVRPTLTLSSTATPDTVRDEIGNELRAAAAISTTGEGVRWELNLLSALSLTRAPSALEALVGMRVPFKHSWELYALGGVGFGSRPGTPLARALVGIAFDNSRPAPRPPEVETFEPFSEQIVAAAEPERAPVVDADDDGLVDGDDQCPMEPGPMERNGCPARDTDQDGVIDERDSCPTVPGPEQNDGCPEKEKKSLVKITDRKLEIKDAVYFDTGKATLKPKSFPLLDQMATVINEHPEIAHVRVEGHTDNRSGREFNLRLSQARAESVRQYLITKGVAPGRLAAQGFGFDRPVADNATAEGRALNRRTEFMIESGERSEESQTW